MAFSESNFKDLQEALQDAFDEGELEQIVRIDLGLKLEEIAPSRDNFTQRTFKLVDWALRYSRADDLYYASLAKNPRNQKLLALATHLMPLPTVPEHPKFRMNLAPSQWKTTWTWDAGKKLVEIIELESWVGDNRFKGHGRADHGTETEPEIYKYTLTGSVEPVGVIVLRYWGKGYPFEGRKNVGVAMLEIKNENLLTGRWAGYQDNRDRAQQDKDRMTYPESAVEPDKFFIPLERMSYSAGTVEMRRGG